MKIFNKLLGFGSMAAAALLLSANASAGPVFCDEGPPDTGRYMSLTDISGGTPSCHLTASGNDANQDPWQNWDLLWKIDGSPWTIDGSSTSGSGPNPFISFSGGGGTSGAIELIAGLTDHYLVFKYGQGSGDPDVFSFHINGMTAATWELFANPGSGLNGLSHISIYGPPTEPPPPFDVPAPGALALMGLGLLGIGLRLRRKRAV